MRSCNNCCSGKAINITYSEYVSVVLGIQHVKRMHHVVICGLPCSAVSFHLSSMAWFRKTVFLTRNVCFDFLYKFCLKHFLFYEQMSEIWLSVHIGLHVKCPLLLSDFNETWIFSRDFRRLFKHKIPWKSVQWEPNCSLRTEGRTDGQTDMTTLTVAFRNFTNALKNLNDHQWLVIEGNSP